MNSILDNVRELCKTNKVTLTKLEKDLGFGNKVIFSWKNVSPSVEKAKAVADYFGVTIDYLVADKENPPKGDSNIDRYFKGNTDYRELFEVARKCSPNEVKIAIRLIKALRGEE